MDLHSEILNMFTEIDNYFGNFGDPIATEFTFSPLETLLKSGSDDFIICGSGVGLLVNFSVFIDNNNYSSALNCHAFKDIQKALDSKLLCNFPDIEYALKSASKTESLFYSATKVVYDKLIKPRLVISNKKIKLGC